MTTIHDVEQRSAEWFAIRLGRITGTSLKDLMNKKPVTQCALFYRLAAEACGDQEQKELFTSKDMQLGIDREPIARLKAGPEYKEYGFITNSNIPNAGLSPDGLTEDLKNGVEIKCPGWKSHINTLITGEIPDEYKWQVVHYFVVVEELEEMLFYSYRPENTKHNEVRVVVTRAEMAIEIEAAKARLKEMEQAVWAVTS